MSSDTDTVDGTDITLKMSELVDILRKGSSAAATRWDSQAADRGLSSFQASSIQDILSMSKKQETIRDTRMKQEFGDGIKDETVMVDLHEEERLLLSGITQVKSRLFEGQHHERTDDTSSTSTPTSLSKRERSDRLVVVNGIESLPMESPITVRIGPQKTIKAAPKKRLLQHEQWCVFCRDGGDLVCCGYYPRVWHPECVGLTLAQAKRQLSTMCAQHACAVCGRKTADAGGMLYRCRYCSTALCEDCLPPDEELDAVGPTLPELLAIGYGETTQAYYIRCEGCATRFNREPAFRASWEDEDRSGKAALALIKTESFTT